MPERVQVPGVRAEVLKRVYFPIPKDAMDYEEGVLDCVEEIRDDKGKYWHTKKVKRSKLDSSELSKIKE